MSTPSARPQGSNSGERTISKSQTENDCVLYMLTENELRQINGPIRTGDYSVPSVHEIREVRPDRPCHPLERPSSGHDSIMYMLTGEELRTINGAITGYTSASSQGSSSSRAEITTFLDQSQERLAEQAAAQTSRSETSRSNNYSRSLRNPHIHLMYSFVQEHRDLLEVNKKLRAWSRK